METVLSDQLWGFAIACAAGVVLAVLYYVLRVLRAFLRFGKRAIFFQDIAYMVTAAFIIFLLALATNAGILRFYLLAGAGIGMCVYFLTLGEVTIRLAQLIVRALRAVRRFLRNKIFRPVGRVLRRAAEGIGEKAKKMRVFRKKLQKKP